MLYVRIFFLKLFLKDPGSIMSHKVPHFFRDGWLIMESAENKTRGLGTPQPSHQTLP